MVGSATSGQMVLGSTRKQAEQARGTSQGNKPVSSTPLRPLLQPLLQGSAVSYCCDFHK